MSSPTVLFVLDKLLRENTPNPGANALVTALGPGFSAENLLLRF
jgi:predicted naringenin-chalcone synthase